MHISLADSSRNGFKKWSAAHTAMRKPDWDNPADADEHGRDPLEAAPAEWRHRPWLVPGIGGVL